MNYREQSRLLNILTSFEALEKELILNTESYEEIRENYEGHPITNIMKYLEDTLDTAEAYEAVRRGTAK